MSARGQEPSSFPGRSTFATADSFQLPQNPQIRPNGPNQVNVALRHSVAGFMLAHPCNKQHGVERLYDV